MKLEIVSVVLLAFVATALGSGFSCFDNVECEVTKPLVYKQDECSAEWGAFPRVNKETNDLIAQQLQSSFEYLLMSSHFKTWKYNHLGFADYFRKLSDANWGEAQSLLLHAVERGGYLVNGFEVDMSGGPNQVQNEIQLYPIQALTRALDKERRTATRTLHLAHLANHGKDVPHDAEFANFLSERLSHDSVLRIKHLANNVRILSDILTDESVDPAYALFKFDENLK